MPRVRVVYVTVGSGLLVTPLSPSVPARGPDGPDARGFRRYRREHNMRENKHFLILSCVTVWIGSFWFRIPVPSLRLRRGRSSVVRAGFRAAGRAAERGCTVQRDHLDAGATLTSDPTPVGVAPYGRPTRVRLRQQQHADRWRAFDTASRSIEQRLRYRRVPPVCTPNETSKRNRPRCQAQFLTGMLARRSLGHAPSTPPARRSVRFVPSHRERLTYRYH